MSDSALCEKCGQAMPVGAQFCPTCGSRTQIFHAPIGASDSVQTMLPASASAPTAAFTSVGTSLNSTIRPGVEGPFRAGDQVGPRYTIIRLLGQGGMGAVYQAFDHELGVGVAIKVIRPAADGTIARDLELRFKRELVLARQITHKHVVRIHDIGEVDGIKYLTMPFVEGQTLADVLRVSGKLPVSRALLMAKQVALGLAAAHDKGIIHRDLKPENIMIEKGEPPEGGDALIMDFGIARTVQHGGTQTAAGAVVGTLEYMAPEQGLGKQLDQRIDIYAFGLILYDTLIGRQRVHTGDSAMSELLTRMTQPPPPARSIDPTIPEAIDRIINKCLAPNPDDRFQTTHEIVAALEALTPDGHDRVAPAPVVAVVPPPAARPRWQYPVVAALVLAAGIGGWFLSNRGGSAAPAAPRDPVSVLVADFQNNTGDPVFNGVLEQAFSLGLEGATFISAYPQAIALRSAAAIKPGSRLDEATARLVATRDGIKLVLLGSVSTGGSGFTMSVRAIDAVDGKQVASADGEAREKGGVLAAVGEMATRLRRELGDSAAGGDDSGRETFTAASLEAARAYAAGSELANAGKFNEAIVQYQEAVQRDPNFGRAYSGWATAAFRAGRPAEAEEQAKKALSLMERMTEREKYRTLGGYYLGPGANDEQAVENYKLLVEKYPADGPGLNNLAVAYFRVLDFKRAAEQGQRAAAVYPNSLNYRTNVALFAMYASDFTTAVAEAKKAIAIGAFDKSYLPIAIAALAAGKPDEARAAYGDMSKVSARGASIAAMGLADIDMYLGRFDEARAELTAGAAADEAGKLAAPQALKLIALAEIAAVTGRSAEVAPLVSKAVALSSAEAVLLPAARLLITTGKADAAAPHIAALEKQIRKRGRALAAVAKAESLLGSRKAVEAIDALTTARGLADLWLVRYMLGRAYIEAERYADAVAELEECQKRIGEASDVFLDDWPTFRYTVPLNYYLGRAQEGLGIKDSAVKNYQAYLALRSGVSGDALAADARKRTSQ